MHSPAMSAQEVVGIDLGGTKMLTGVLGRDSEVLWQSRERSTGQSEEQLVDLLVEEIEEARRERPGVLAAGLGIPATIDYERGVAISAVNLPLADLPLREMTTERTGLPVFVDNDANLAALAEHLHGAGRGAEDMVLLTIGTGIGGGLILGGEVYRGASGAGAELGHLVIAMDGLRCQGNCPGHGCVETYASGTAIAREGMEAAERHPDSVLAVRLAEGEAIDGRAVTEAALAGDAAAIEVFELVGSRLGVALTSLANIFQPELFVIGGGAMAAGDLLLDPARRMLGERALPPMNTTPVCHAQLGADAGMIGAASLARIELEREGLG
jgi:glucokinase